MRIEGLITQDESKLILQQILPTASIENIKGQQMRIWILILGVKGLQRVQ